MEFKTKEEREKFIQDKMYLISKVVKYYSKQTGIDIHELESYAYEGLIVGIDDYQCSGSMSLSLYLNKKIKWSILRGTRAIQKTCMDRYYYEFIKARADVEEINCTTLKKDPSILKEIIDLMIERGQIKENNRKNFEKSVLFGNPDKLIQHQRDLVYPEEALIYRVTYDSCKKQINQIISKLSPAQQIVIRELYGLDDSEPHSLKEIANQCNYTSEGIRRIKNRAFTKLSKKDLEILRSFLDIFDTYDGDSLGIAKVKLKK